MKTTVKIEFWTNKIFVRENLFYLSYITLETKHMLKSEFSGVYHDLSVVSSYIYTIWSKTVFAGSQDLF